MAKLICLHPGCDEFLCDGERTTEEIRQHATQCLERPDCGMRKIASSFGFPSFLKEAPPEPRGLC